MYYKLNENKEYEPCSLMEWSNQIQQLRQSDKKHVAQDIINGKLISTVWLGIDHNFKGGEPLLFETMVFEDENVGVEIYLKRYSTWKEAEEGHQEAIDWVKKNYGLKDESKTP